MLEWTPEAVKAEMNYKLETARRHAVVRQARQAKNRQPSWWKRLRTQHNTE